MGANIIRSREQCKPACNCRFADLFRPVCHFSSTRLFWPYQRPASKHWFSPHVQLVLW